jgi:F-type H+-transporting ATPase subunit epsilon
VLKVSVISPEAVLFEGDAESVVAPAYDGEVGILTGHAPMVTLLGRGAVRVGGGSATRRFQVEGGFLQVADDQVRVVTERAAPVAP